MDGKTRPIPAMPIDADSILAAALRTCDEHGVPVKALACADAPERTIYRWMGDDSPRASLAGGVAVLRRMPPEIQVAAARQLFPDIAVNLDTSAVAPARSVLGGVTAVVGDAAALLVAAEEAHADRRVTAEEAAHINAAIDQLVRHAESLRVALTDNTRRKPGTLAIANP